MMKHFNLCVVVVMAVVLTAGFALAGTLEEVRARGHIIAGVNGGVFGFSMPGLPPVSRRFPLRSAQCS